VRREYQYPKLGEDKRKPDRNRDGNKDVGKPCIVCDKFTLGIKWIQIDYMRGNDVDVPVCFDHWKRNQAVIVEAFMKANGYD
jgi:hypothetical protein